MSSIPTSIPTCLCCGADSVVLTPVLWPSLIDEWRLTPEEAEYVNRQQGLHCTNCGCNLRSMALAMAVMRCFGYRGLLREFVRQKQIRPLRILELNEAGHLTRFLAQLPGHLLTRYPEVDMMAMPFPAASFDLVIHSDTLEHVERPIQALSECCRVLRPGGFCAFTVPMIVNRLTASRRGRAPSYHGAEQDRQPDFLVHTEYGGDAWRHVVEAGFEECRIYSLEYPAAQALVGVKRGGTGDRARSRRAPGAERVSRLRSVFGR